MLNFIFYVAIKLGLSRHNSFAIFLDRCRDRVKIVATFFFTFFFNNVVTQNFFVTTEILFLPCVQPGLCCDIQLLAVTLFFWFA